jgi:hypothetical protein
MMENGEAKICDMQPQLADELQQHPSARDKVEQQTQQGLSALENNKGT